MSRPWSKSEDARLLTLAGTLPPDRVRSSFPGRTPRQVDRRVYDHHGINYRRGAYSFKALRDATGYDWRQLLRAKDALGQKWARGAPVRANYAHNLGRGGTRWLISEDQADALIAWLAAETKPRRWAKRWRRCRKCKRTDSRHAGRGLCNRCKQRGRPSISEPCPKCGARPLTLARLLARARARRWYAKTAPPRQTERSAATIARLARRGPRGRFASKGATSGV